MRRKSIPMGDCVMFTRNVVNPSFCGTCGYHEVVHAKEQNPGMDVPSLELPEITPGSLSHKLHVDPKFPRGLTADRIYAAKEKEMVAYNQRSNTIKAHEYVLNNPAAGGDISVAIDHARRDKAITTGSAAVSADSVMVRATDEEIIVYWTEEVKE